MESQIGLQCGFMALDVKKALVRVEFPVFPEGCKDKTFREVYQLSDDEGEGEAKKSNDDKEEDEATLLGECITIQKVRQR